MNELDFSQYPDELLRSLSPSQIIELRKIMAGNQAAQNRLSSVDHRMFARDAAATEGPLAALAIGAASPAYQISKMQFGPHSAPSADDQTSQPSWQQFIEGYKGLGEGLGDWLRNGVKTKARNPLDGTKNPMDARQLQQQALFDQIRSLPPEVQREFIAEQMSYGVPDSSVQYPQVEPEGQAAVMDMIRRQRLKSQNLLSNPL